MSSPPCRRTSWSATAGLSGWLAIGATAFFIALDALLLASCSTKIVDGGWFPLVLAGLLMVVMTAWKRGRELLSDTLRADMLPIDSFVEGLAADAHLLRVDRTAVFLSAERGVVPQALLHNMKHNLVLHKRNVILTIQFHEDPTVPAERRVQVEQAGAGFWQVTVHFGFTQQPDIPKALALCEQKGLPIDAFATPFLSCETVVPPRGRKARCAEPLRSHAQRRAGDHGIPYNAGSSWHTRCSARASSASTARAVLSAAP
jgi:KUP system potassium uptake protein